MSPDAPFAFGCRGCNRVAKTARALLAAGCEGRAEPLYLSSLNSPDWHDGFQTASAENCFNEKQEIAALRAELTKTESGIEP